MSSERISSLPSLYCPINQVGQRDRTRERERGAHDDDERERKEGDERVRGGEIKLCACVYVCVWTREKGK